jgi:hypothetical protein
MKKLFIVLVLFAAPLLSAGELFPFTTWKSKTGTSLVAKVVCVPSTQEVTLQAKNLRVITLKREMLSEESVAQLDKLIKDTEDAIAKETPTLELIRKGCALKLPTRATGVTAKIERLTVEPNGRSAHAILVGGAAIEYVNRDENRSLILAGDKLISRKKKIDPAINYDRDDIIATRGTECNLEHRGEPCWGEVGASDYAIFRVTLESN